MEPGFSSLDKGKEETVCSTPDQQAQPDQQLAWRCNIKDEGENRDLSSLSRRSSKMQENATRQLTYNQDRSNDDQTENWLSASCWSRRTSTRYRSLLQELLDDEQQVPAYLYHLLESEIEMGAASVADAKYRDFLGYRNIYIGDSDPPVELMHQAREIISQPRALPEMDDANVEELRHKIRKLESEAEVDITNLLTQHLIPTPTEICNQNLAQASQQLWSDSVPIPLDPDIFTHPLPLPRPTPDHAFGYSSTAFTKNQLATIRALVDAGSERSYAAPNRNLFFPFLSIEFKSDAKGGTHYIASNQSASSGAIAISGYMELTQRASLSLISRDVASNEQPLFFSISMNHAYAQINLHWVNTPTKDTGGQCSFHAAVLAQHFLADVDGMRAVKRAIMNILDYAAGAPRRVLAEKLDAYREVFLAARHGDVDS